MDSQLLIETRALTKKFGDVTAVDHVDMGVYRGEIRGLIGENGSGKSTISSMIYGIHSITSGEILLDGKRFAPENPGEARTAGISMIVQETGTVDALSVAENIFLGDETRFRHRGMIDRAALNREAELALSRIGVSDMDVQAPVSSYNFEKRKIVEIAKALYYDPRLFIVDETTSVLSHESREIIYSLMKGLKEKNRAILFISHALDELMEVCDVLTVLRDGALTDTIPRRDFDENRIKQSMVGRELIDDYYRSDYDGSTDEEIVLSVNDVTTQALKSVSFELHKGEILGVAGLSGSGMHELGRLAFGMEEVRTGQVFAVNPADGTQVEIVDIHSALKCSMGYISKDRDKETLIVSASIKDNLALSALDQLGPVISPRAEKAFALEQVENLLIKCSSINQEVGELSGGNKQKVSFGKWIGNRSKILVMDSPTRGVDVGIKTAMYQLIYELKKSGYSILLISEEMGELIGMSDSILVMKDGGINKRFCRDRDLSEAQIIDYLI